MDDRTKSKPMCQVIQIDEARIPAHPSRRAGGVATPRSDTKKETTRF
jgi:hypothetical protein